MFSSYALTIQYKGTRYCGWQKQLNATTIQDTLEEALKKLFKPEHLVTVGSGRTDTGVHALGQVVRVEMDREYPAEVLKKALNSTLPKDIRVKESKICDENFHPIHSANSKEYHYFFNFEELPLLDETVTFLQYPLDIELMKKGARLFEGEHDFKNYYCVGTDIKSTVRRIDRCEIKTYKSEPYGMTYYALEIEGSGFLKQMVRLIMGTLFALGQKKVTLDQIADSFEAGTEKLGATAPARGLHLVKVNY